MTGKVILRLWLWATGGIFLLALAFVLVIQLMPFDSSKLISSANPTVVYARDGSVYMTIASSNASHLAYAQIPQDLQQAIVATEDHSFWNSSSIDFRGLVRAAFVDLWSQRFAQGGSTIQEQLAKIVYLNDKKTIWRKVQQIALGIQINRHFTKQEILTMYLNRVFLGENCIGAQQAAMRYFGVDLVHHPDALTLPQAALLAGLPQAPSAYDPLVHPAAALARRNIVLDNMARYGDITQAAADAAKKQPLGVKDHGPQGTGWDTHPLFLNFLADYLSKNDILTQEELLRGGLKIYTTIDPKVQNAISQVFSDPAYRSDFPADMNGTPAQGAAVFVDPKTGDILGGAGSRMAGFAAFGDDRAIRLDRSPGSSIKPVMEYGPAIESGNWGPNSILDNTPQDFGNYTPHNDSANTPGQVTLQYALTQSQNVASVWLLKQIGIQNGVAFARNDGITIPSSAENHLDIAIGGELGVNPLEMAQAYEAFDNQGVQMQAHLVTRIANSSGEFIYQHTPSSKQIMSAQTAAVMTELMQGVVQYGTGVYAQVPGWAVAGKTGTVQYGAGISGDHPDWVRDVWFDGYTPNLVGSVWVGFDQTDAAHHLFWYDAPNHYPSKVFADVTALAEAGVPAQQFTTGALPQPQQSPVSDLVAAWDPVTQAVQLTWKSSESQNVMFVITKLPQGNLPTPGNNATGTVSPSNGTTGSGSPPNQPIMVGQTSQLTYEDPGVAPGEAVTYVVQAEDTGTGQSMGPSVSLSFTVPQFSLQGSGGAGG